LLGNPFRDTDQDKRESVLSDNVQKYLLHRIIQEYLLHRIIGMCPRWIGSAHLTMQ